MTDDDDTTTPAGGGDEGPITPEVVRRGAAGRKRRVVPGTEPDGPAPDDGPAPLPGRPVRQANGRTFRRGCTVLTALGVLVLINGVRLIASPASVRCESARAAIEEAVDDDDEFNDVDLPEGTADDEIGDLECDTAIALAGGIPEDEDDEPNGEWISESAIRNFGLLYGGVGVLLGAAGFTMLRKQTRTVRTAVLAVTILSMLVVAPAMTLAGIPIGLLMIVYVVYALGFSADAKALFPVDRTRPSLFRPRPPAGS